jgi:D-glycero-D-manno-heptose 1,7-bisphosphate phosphatase
LYTHETVHEIHDFLHRTCQEANVEIKHIFYSPHHPEFGNSLSRKPERLLLERAIARYDIDPLQSVMIGDRDRDIQCAAQVGVRGILIPTNADLIDSVRTLA